MNWLNNYLTPDIAQEVFKNKDLRLQLCEKYIFFFGLLYFPHYFTHEPAPFHLGMCKDLTFENWKYLMWIMFRGSAKTAWAKIKLLHNICYKKKMFNVYACFDTAKAEARLYDVAIQLQTNKDLIRDFGQLYFDDNLKDVKHSKKKSIPDFICSNKVKVQAFSTKTSVQGLNYDSYRPDFWVLDDFETWDTVKSSVKTKSILDWFEGELMGGEDVDTEILFLCNRLSKFGIVKHLEGRAKNNPDWKIRDVPVEKDSKMAWPQRFVFTDAEKKEKDQMVTNPKEQVVSLESKKRNTSLAKYNANYYNNPLNPLSAAIQEEWITSNYYTELPNVSDMDIYIAVDPAGGLSQKADFTAICVLGRHRLTGLLYVIEMYNEKIGVPDQLIRVPEVWRLWQTARALGVEVVRNQRALFQLLSNLSQGENPVYLPLVPINPRGKDKLTRLQYHESSIRSGKVKFNQYHIAFHDQLLAFPDPEEKEHDDMVDAFIYALDMATQGIQKEESSVEDEVNKQLNGAMTIAGNIMDMAF